MTPNPYQSFVTSLARTTREGKKIPLGNLPHTPRPLPAQNAPVVLIFSPHPDDECIIGGLALRLQRESGYRAINVAVTHGSNRVRQPERLKELKNACDYLNFGLIQTAPNGLESIQTKTRTESPAQWNLSVKIIAHILTSHQPRAILFPHKHDWNSTHFGTHHLLLDALQTLPTNFSTFLIETEYWAPMSDPNLMIELSETDLADLIAALSCHVGEVKRNPYHLTLPAWMMDNVRRAELVGGQGSPTPDFRFATLYRLRQWKQGSLHKIEPREQFLAINKNPANIFPT